MSFHDLLHNFRTPSSEFTLIPFWFLNDRFDADSLRRQLRDFHAKGVDGVVLHPRMGVPDDIEYMSEAFLDAIEVCVKEAAALGMRVVLYDEGMYPSGSACGQVVARDPRYASRRLERHRTMPENAELVTACGGWYYTLGYTGGHIRGIHADQEDDMPGAPASGDLLNPEAMAVFLELTHERYYARLAPYFGSVIIGMFTDEPSISGRGADLAGGVSWTYGLLEEYAARLPEDLPLSDALDALFEPSHPRYRQARQLHRQTAAARLQSAFFGQQGRWCAAHGIGLMGHPSGSGETAPLVHFAVPGQDLVWRYVEPGNTTRTAHSVLGKSAVDMARLMGCRRNSNELFGCCSNKDNPWEFRFDEMLWYANFLLLRGCNLFFPHAFFYSLRTPVQSGERPPDVGPGNIWWPHYRSFADYCSRICMLNTDCRTEPLIGILCDGDNAPCLCAAPLWENGIEFSYISAALPGLTDCFDGGRLTINGCTFTTLFWEEDIVLPVELVRALEAFEQAGGRIIRRDFDRDLPTPPAVFSPNSALLRRSTLLRDGLYIYLLFNESDDRVIEGDFTVPGTGAICRLDAWTGSACRLPSSPDGAGLRTHLCLAPGELVILTAAPEAQALPPAPAAQTFTESIPLGFSASYPFRDRAVLDAAFALDHIPEQAMLRFDDVHDQATVLVNGRCAGALFHAPWTLSLTGLVKTGINTLHIELQGSRANLYGSPVPVYVEGAYLDLR